jgi:hypothetical protein
MPKHMFAGKRVRFLPLSTFPVPLYGLCERLRRPRRRRATLLSCNRLLTSFLPLLQKAGKTNRR